MLKKALITGFTFQQEGIDKLKDSGYEVIFNPAKHAYREEEIFELIHDIDVYIAGADPITRRVIDHAPKLKIIARLGVGFDSVDWRYAGSKGIPVTITPGTNEKSVAEMAFALILGLARKIPSFDRSIRSGIWQPQILGTELWGKTIGIIGTGRIGKAVAQRANGFEMRPIAYDPFRDEAWAEKNSVPYVSLEQLVQTSDFITLHTPLTPETESLVSDTFLSQMKPSAYLINTARGKLVDEEALYQALSRGSIAGAALDVYTQEPFPTSHKLLGLDNCVFTCHISSHTVEAMVRMSLLCVDEIIRVERGEAALYAVANI